MVCNELVPITADGVVKPTGTTKLWLKISEHTNAPYDKIMAVLSGNPGKTPVVLYDERTKERKLVGEEFWTEAGDSVILELRQILGDGCVVVK